MGDLLTVNPRELKTYPANYNTHPPEQIDELVRSLDQFDQPKNIVIWQGHILAGHGLVEAAIKANRLTIEARDVSEWSQEKAEAFLIADNETARMGRADAIKLAGLVEQVKSQGVAVPGVTEARLAEIVAEAKAVEVERKDLSDGIKHQYMIVITCETEEEQVQLFNEFQGRELQCRLLIS